MSNIHFPPLFNESIRGIIFAIFQYMINPDYYGGETGVMTVIRNIARGLHRAMTFEEIESLNAFIQLLLQNCCSIEPMPYASTFAENIRNLLYLTVLFVRNPRIFQCQHEFLGRIRYITNQMDSLTQIELDILNNYIDYLVNQYYNMIRGH